MIKPFQVIQMILIALPHQQKYPMTNSVIWLVFCLSLATASIQIKFFDSDYTDLENATGGALTALLDALRQGDLLATNNYRAAHGVNLLQLDASLNADAQAYAEDLVDLGRLQHDPSATDGQNLFYANGPRLGGHTNVAIFPKGAATDSWYSEEPLYDYDNPPANGSQFSAGGYGHFTALIWKNVERVGFGYATSPNDNGNMDLYVVARYSPTPNYLGQFAANVMPPLSELTHGGWYASGANGWNGTDNSDDAPNLPRLQTILNQGLTSLNDNQTPKNVAQNISDECNLLWDIAWNVAIFKGDMTNPIIIYAYAFRGHWAWYNRFRGSGYSIAVWKDYNCITWAIFDHNDATQYDDLADNTAIQSALSSLSIPEDDIWLTTKRSIEAIEDSFGQMYTYSGVGFIDNIDMSAVFTVFAIRFCWNGENWTFVKRTNTEAGRQVTYAFFVFTTRAGNYRAPR